MLGVARDSSVTGTDSCKRMWDSSSHTAFTHRINLITGYSFHAIPDSESVQYSSRRTHTSLLLCGSPSWSETTHAFVECLRLCLERPGSASLPSWPSSSRHSSLTRGAAFSCSIPLLIVPLEHGWWNHTCPNSARRAASHQTLRLFWRYGLAHDGKQGH